MIDRRQLLGRGALGLAAGCLPRLAVAAAPTDARFVFIIQRGAADGLGTLAPLGDPAYAGLRGVLAEDVAAGAKLDAMFTLHPALANVATMYRAGEALFAHAVASPYRDRSHFDGQNVLESGGATAYARADGWMNRLIGLIGPAERGIAVASTIPLAMRGRVEVASYAPSALPDASDDLLRRIGALYTDDAALHPLWEQAMATRTLAGDVSGDDGRNAAATGTLAAKLLAPVDGARIAMIETGGWDTHTGQRARLALQLKGLDAMLAALKTGLGAAWGKTVVVVATEFGRTAAANGTGGTDHGTASLAMLIGGAVRGGRVLADWPGLAPASLYEGRDLKPTMALDAVIAGAAAGLFAVDPARTGAALFPGFAGQRPVEGLVRA